MLVVLMLANGPSTANYCRIPAEVGMAGSCVVTCQSVLSSSSSSDTLVARRSWERLV